MRKNLKLPFRQKMEHNLQEFKHSKAAIQVESK